MFRVISTDFWTDPLVIDDFTPEDRYFMLYLLTNPHTKQCGIYQLNIKIASFETGYSKDTISSLIERFQNKYDRIVYNSETQEVGIYNYIKHSIVKGGTPVNDCIRKELSQVKDALIIKLVYDHMRLFFESTEKESFKQIEKIFLEFISNDNENGNENDNDNEDSYPESYHESSTSVLEATIQEFKEFRKSIKKPLTKHAVDLLKSKLDSLANTDDEKIHIINKSILNGWTGIYKDNDYRSVTNTKTIKEPESEHPPMTEEAMRMAEEAMRGNVSYGYTTSKT